MTNAVNSIQTNPQWESVWQMIFSQKLTEREYQRLCEVKNAFETQELLLQGDFTKLSKNKALAYYPRLEELRRPKLVAELIASKPDNYHLVTDVLSFNQVLSWLSQESIIALDTETTGLEIFGEDRIVGLSMTFPTVDQHVYIPVRHEVPDPQLEPQMVFEALKPYFENEQLKKVLFNAKFDFHMLRKENIKVKGLLMDVFVAAHILNENEESYKLKNLATRYGKYFGFENESSTYEELFGRGGFEKTPLEAAVVYACKDTHLTYGYYQFICKQFNRLPGLKQVYEQIENPLIEVCIEMERTGFLIDMSFAQNYQQKLETELNAISTQLKAYLGEVDLNSVQQLKKVFYDELKLPDVSKSRKLDAETLKALKDHHPSVELLLKYREISKLLSTYVKPLPQLVDEHYRLHGSFNQCGTKTGRFSSSNPNLQNFPKNARKMIIPAPGKIIVGIDYSQIEPRFLSHLTQDPSFMQAYIDGRDLYSEIASKTFNLPISECGDGSKWRKMIKTGMLATMYGTSAYTLAKQLQISEAEAQKFIDDFFNSYPVMKNWIQQVDQFADTYGYVETAWGRKRRFPGHPQVAQQRAQLHQQISQQLNKSTFNIWEEKVIPYSLRKTYSEIEKTYAQVRRQSPNSIIQGSAADLMKIALIKLHQFLESKGPEWRMLATIHDEVLFEIPATATREEIEALAAVQRDAVQLRVPMKVDIEICQRWGCGMSLDEWMKHKESPLSLTHTL